MDYCCKPLEFGVVDIVRLKVSPWKGVVRFGEKGGLAPKCVGPFQIYRKECVCGMSVGIDWGVM